MVDITLPPMPDNLAQLRHLQRVGELDVAQLTDLVANDVAMSAEVLKTINSALFSRGQTISSISTAVMLLGPPNVLNLLSATTLRRTMNCGAHSDVRMERFWETATDVAYATSRYAQELSGIPADMAYTLGLFHDCGIPVLMCKYQDYTDTLRRAGQGEDLIALEEARYPVNHARLGSLISEKWMLPGTITEAIRWHHAYEELVAERADVDEVVVTLVALLKMAEYTSVAFRGVAFGDDAQDEEWQRLKTPVLSHFDIDEDDFEDIKESLLLELGQR